MEQVCKISVFFPIVPNWSNFGQFLATLVTSADVGVFCTFGLFWQISAFFWQICHGTKRWILCTKRWFLDISRYFSVRNDDFSVRNDDISVRNDDFPVRNDDFSVSNLEGIGPFLATLVTSADVGVFGTFGLFWQISAFFGKFVTVRNDEFSVRNDILGTKRWFLGTKRWFLGTKRRFPGTKRWFLGLKFGGDFGCKWSRFAKFVFFCRFSQIEAILNHFWLIW